MAYEFEADYVFVLELKFTDKDTLSVHIISPDVDEFIIALEDDLHLKYIHKESDRSKYKFKKLWTLKTAMTISTIANSAMNKKHLCN